MASNFLSSMQWLAAEYSQETGQPMQVMAGATGKLYAQIRQGAPYDLFFAADDERPARLVAEDYALADSRVTYALGRLALWQAGAVQPPTLKTLLASNGKVAIANPRLAPYGRAAEEVLTESGLWDRLKSRLLRGENVGQAFQYVHAGQAEWGLVPLSMLLQAGVPASEYLLLKDSYTPIRQQAVVLRGTNERTAAAFLGYCQSHKARTYLLNSGYGLP